MVKETIRSRPSPSQKRTVSDNQRKSPSNQRVKLLSLDNGDDDDSGRDQDRFRSLKSDLTVSLKRFISLRSEWDDIVLTKAIGQSIKVIELESEIESTLSNSDSVVRECEGMDQVRLKDGYAWKQYCKLDQLRQKLLVTIDDMFRVIQSVQDVIRQIEDLMFRSSKEFGNTIALESPVWYTWSLSRFYDYILELSEQFNESIGLNRCLINVISNTSTTDQDGKTTATMSERQAALSYLACQPMLYNRVELEEIFSVEIEDWNLIRAKP
ncbi:expressed protein [Phakopsora pachyrhizi]|uniref:Expressed protein n=1 Tax=Phakopsora pachyrhizi TaxID=170000 RepID=A0AAV0B281_PHAPC|nr:expressed protein [Phakopsora pachyrhizi]